MMEWYDQILAWYNSLGRIETCVFLLISCLVAATFGRFIRHLGRSIYYERRIAIPHKELLIIRDQFKNAMVKDDLRIALNEFSAFLRRNNRSLHMQITEEEFKTMQFHTVHKMCMDSFEFFLEEFEKTWNLPITRKTETMEKIG